MDLGHGDASKLDNDPDDAAGELVAEAHEEAKAALTELRDLVRGIHPAILEDRGLDAALSAVVARSPVPVAAGRRRRAAPSPAAVESAAYFVVAEALDQRGQARRRDPRPRSRSPAAGDRLVIEVRDNGSRRRRRRPAAPGCAASRDRVAALGGSMQVVSPLGGPTTVLGGAAVRIVIAEDSVLLRAGLTRLLADAGEEVVAAVGDADG